MRGLGLLLLLGLLAGCGSSAAEKEPTKADFSLRPKPAGFGPGGGSHATPPPTGK